VRLKVPVIIVGNLTVGGTGKTPLLLALVEALCAKGYAPEFSSGVRRNRARTPRGERGDDAARAGDEPLLLAERSGCPVWIGADRAAAAAPRCSRPMLAAT